MGFVRDQTGAAASGLLMRLFFPLLVFALPALSPAPARAQFPGLSLPPSGNNQKAAVTQFIGPVKVTVEYSSPAVHGPDPDNPASPAPVDRRGRIWGKLVPYGLTDLGFGHRKPAPWRAGANENTVFEVSHPVEIEGQPLPAGRYGLHMIAGPEEWTIILSREAHVWGSFFYEASQDALRVKVKPARHQYREYLTYDFTERKPAEARVEMQWEDLAVGWRIHVPKLNDVYLSRLRAELHDSPGFSWRAWVQAVQFSLQNGGPPEEALEWADYAIAAPFVGEANFSTLSTKAQVLAKLGRAAEAETAIRAAVEHRSATPPQIHQYGRQLLAEGKIDRALEIFELNHQRHGDVWPIHVGLARGYSAKGEKAKALEHARRALAQAPDALNRKSLEDMVKTLSAATP